VMGKTEKRGRRGLTGAHSTKAEMLQPPPPFRPGRPPFVASLLCSPSSPPSTSASPLAFAAASASEMELRLCLRLHARLPPATPPPLAAPAVLPASRRIRTGKDLLQRNQPPLLRFVRALGSVKMPGHATIAVCEIREFGLDC
jgi:hypothetical protein